MKIVSRVIRKLNSLIRPKEIQFNQINIFIDILYYPKLFFLRLFKTHIGIKKILISKFKKEIKLIHKNDYYINHKNYTKEEVIDFASRSLSKNGVTIIENGFSENEINDFRKLSDELIPEVNNSKTDNYMNYNKKLIPLKNDFFLLSEIIINTIEKSINKKKSDKEFLYVRENSRTIWFGPSEKNLNNNWTAGWHVDFPTQFAVHVILDDLDENSTRMQVIPLSNNLFLVPSRHYNIDIFENNNELRNKIINLVGKKGTIYIHSGTVLHRNFPVINKSRYLWGATYTTDPVFLLNNSKKNQEFFYESSDTLENLSQTNKKRLEGLLGSRNNTIESKGYYRILKNKYFKEVKKGEVTYI